MNVQRKRILIRYLNSFSLRLWFSTALWETKIRQRERERACVTESEWVSISTGKTGWTSKQVSSYRWGTKVGWAVEGVITMTKGFSCLARLYILVADRVKQLEQREATLYELGQKKPNSKNWTLHNLQRIPLQDHVKTRERMQEPVGLQGEKVFSCSLVRFADCHKVLATISSYSSLFS